MVCLSDRQVAKRAASRPPGYLAELDAITTRRDERGRWIDTATAAYRRMRAKYRARCTNCHGPHPTSKCPIPDDFDPEHEQRRLRTGGCCGGNGKR